MKILGLHVENIRKLRAVDMQFTDKGLIPIVGNNQAGKTSILDSLEILIRGMKYSNDDIITHGEERSEIIGTIGEYQIKRVITKSSNRIEITNKDGLQVSGSPQKFLDSLVNELTFDPRPFMDKSGDQKMKFMLDLFSVNFEEIDKELVKAQDERTLVGREGKALGGEKEAEKAERVDVEKLYMDAQRARSLNEEMDRAIKERKQKEDDVAEMERRLKEMKKELSESKTVEQLEGEKLDLEVHEERLRNASKINEKAAEYEAALAHNEKVKAKRKEYEGLTAKIKKLRQKKNEKLKEINIPVEGLEIRSDGIYHNGIYSENWSDSEAMKISSELCLAMNPKLRSVFIDKGESYDSKQLEVLRKWAESNDIQAFITIVDDIPGKKDRAPGVFYIEEGQISDV